jgi:hypothetical protein
MRFPAPCCQVCLARFGGKGDATCSTYSQPARASRQPVSFSRSAGIKDRRSPGSAPPSFQHGAYLALPLQAPYRGAHSMAPGQKLQDGTAADKAGSAGSQNCAHCRLLAVHYIDAGDPIRRQSFAKSSFARISRDCSEHPDREGKKKRGNRSPTPAPQDMTAGGMTQGNQLCPASDACDTLANTPYS